MASTSRSDGLPRRARHARSPGRGTATYSGEKDAALTHHAIAIAIGIEMYH